MSQLLRGPVRDFLRTARDGGIRSAWEFLLSPRIRFILPGLARAFEPAAVEVHVLTGSSRLTMAFWMMASWIVATRRSWRFVIHDDGTLRQEDVAGLKKLLPDCRVLLNSESNPEITARLASYPLSLKCRNLHPFGKRLFDFPMLATGDRFISIDTDVLFFMTPERLIRWCGESDPGCIFFEDIKDASLLETDEVQRLFGVPLAQKINAGLFAMPKAALSVEIIEKCLAKTSILTGNPWFMEQTLHAVAASVHGRVELLPKDYVMSLSPQCPPGALARHYVGAIRHLFYSEGIPRVSQNLGRWRRS
jgi:hypothetical protein